MNSACLLLALLVTTQTPDATSGGAWQPVPDWSSTQADEPRSSEVVPIQSGISTTNRQDAQVPSSEQDVTPAEPVRRPNPVSVGSSGAKEQNPTDSPTAIESGPTRLVNQILDFSADSRLTGRPLSLLAALASTRDTNQQMVVVHGYWDAVSLVGQYRIRRRESAELESFEARSEDKLLLLAARASAAAACNEAQIAAMAARQRLVQQATPISSSPQATLPLPTDRPCASRYNTRYELVFAARPAPPQAWLMEQTLPLRREAIGHRADAVDAARQALDTSRQAYRDGQANFERVLTALAAWSQQQQAFLRTVCDYNHDIARYVDSALVAPTDNATLVAMLIGPRLEPQAESPTTIGQAARRGVVFPIDSNFRQGPTPTLAPTADRVRAAGHVEPIDSRSGLNGSSDSRWGRTEPTRDVTPDLFPGGDRLVPVRPRESATSDDQQPATDNEPEAPKVLVVPAE